MDAQMTQSPSGNATSRHGTTATAGRRKLLAIRLLLSLISAGLSAESAHFDSSLDNTGQEKGENGGWKLINERPVGMAGPCNIERVNAEHLASEQFLTSYAYEKPVIIYNWYENSAFRALCTKRTMLDTWGDEEIALNSANTYSYTRVESTFGDYVRNQMKAQDLFAAGNETLYLFGDINPEIWKALLDSYALPRWELPGHEPALSFGIGAVGTGVPFHFHGPGFAEVIFGSKRWFLLPYEKQPLFDPDKSSLHWYTNEYPTLTSDEQRPLECLLRQGELLYFPDKWWHATLNAETAVFMSTFLSPALSGNTTREVSNTYGMPQEL